MSDLNAPDELDAPNLIRLTGLSRQPSLLDTIWVFDGEDEYDDTLTCYVYVDHRMAMDLTSGLHAGDDVLVHVDPWAVHWIPRKQEAT